jgi:hypothetical protein
MQKPTAAILISFFCIWASTLFARAESTNIIVIVTEDMRLFARNGFVGLDYFGVLQD